MVDRYECQPANWADPPDCDEEDDDYYEEVSEDTMKKLGWIKCDRCGEWLRLEDAASGVSCRCGERESE